MTKWQMFVQQVNNTLRRRQKLCKHCGSVFEFQANHPEKEYCNSKCVNEARVIRNKLKRYEEKLNGQNASSRPSESSPALQNAS